MVRRADVSRFQVWGASSVTVLLATLAGIAVAPASAAFPGRNGQLVVLPVEGRGLVLVNSRGGGARRVCTDRVMCGHPVGARWSPDGREIVLDNPSGSRVSVVTASGAWLWCFSATPLSSVGGARPAFTADGSTVTFVSARAS
jgi:DNA-binding beta-propeller fold protein YncE